MSAQIPISGLKNQVAVGDGSVGVPSIAFAGDSNTGLYRPGSDVVAVVTGGVERMRVDSVGKVGIGSTTPQTKLDVVGDIQYTTSMKRNGVVLPMVLNVQQSVYNVKSAGYTPGTTWTDSPIPSLTLTPASASSRFHVRANVTYSMSGGLTTVAFRFVRNDTPVGVGSGGTYNCSFRHVPSTSTGSEQQYWAWSVGGEYIDSPATTSACTYKLQFMSYDGSRTIVFNNMVQNATSGDNNCAISTLTVTELAV